MITFRYDESLPAREANARVTRICDALYEQPERTACVVVIYRELAFVVRADGEWDVQWFGKEEM